MGNGIRPGCWEKEGEVGQKSSQAGFCIASLWNLEQSKVVGRCQHLVRTSTAALVLTGSIYYFRRFHICSFEPHSDLMTPGDRMYV